jgi:malate dehydrogenase (oxaloacetate-decarboxylating)
MVAAAAAALAEYTKANYTSQGLIFPPVTELRAASVKVATAVIRQAIADGVATRKDLPDDLEAFVKERFWLPEYLPFVRAEG